MRICGPLFSKFEHPEPWIAALRAHGYRAAYCPLDAAASDDTVQAFREAAEAADIVIAEVGAWSNPISRNETERRQALEKCQAQLDLAERIGAKCCVNIAGSRGERWDGPHADNLTEDTFDLIVESVRQIIDAVKPKRTFYTLETMPWVFPDSPESYLRLIKAIDRPAFAAHLDPVNMITSPERYFRNGDFIRDCFAKLGPYIKSCHAKDITMSDNFMVHLDEVRPGLGTLDYRAFLTEANRLNPDLPVCLEHLSTEEEYRLAGEHVRAVAGELGYPI